MTISRFRSLVYDYYAKHGRDLPWRRTKDPYRILVSEMMLQQTQVSRVVDKYRLFLARFPTIRTLAEAPLRSVCEAWQGLGYNRRALLLHRLAREVVLRHKGKIPSDRESLRRLPGIGEATSGAICAFAFDQPVTFIETNIRSVFIHHFFRKRQGVGDEELLPLIERSLDRRHPRRWYSALMDYGVYLKSRTPNPSRRSASYSRQSPFRGSKRQLRGKVLRELLQRGGVSERSFLRDMGVERSRVIAVLEALEEEGFLLRKAGSVRIKG